MSSYSSSSESDGEERQCFTPTELNRSSGSSSASRTSSHSKNRRSGQQHILSPQHMQQQPLRLSGSSPRTPLGLTSSHAASSHPSSARSSRSPQSLNGFSQEFASQAQQDVNENIAVGTTSSAAVNWTAMLAEDKENHRVAHEQYRVKQKENQWNYESPSKIAIPPTHDLDAAIDPIRIHAVHIEARARDMEALQADFSQKFTAAIREERSTMQQEAIVQVRKAIQATMSKDAAMMRQKLAEKDQEALQILTNMKSNFQAELEHQIKELRAKYQSQVQYYENALQSERATKKEIETLHQQQMDDVRIDKQKVEQDAAALREKVSEKDQTIASMGRDQTSKDQVVEALQAQVSELEQQKEQLTAASEEAAQEFVQLRATIEKQHEQIQLSTNTNQESLSILEDKQQAIATLEQQLATVQQELATSKENAEELQTQLDEEGQTCANLQDEAERLSLVLIEQRHVIQNLQHENESLQTQAVIDAEAFTHARHQSEQERTVLRGQITDLQGSVEFMQGEVQSMEEDIHHKDERIVALEAEKAHMSQAYETKFAEQASTHKGDIDLMQEEITNLNESRAATERRLEEVQMAQTQSENEQIATLQNEVNNLRLESDSFRSQVEALTLLAEDRGNHVKTLEQELHTVNEELDRVIAGMESQSAQLQSTQTELDQTQAALRASEASTAQIQNELEASKGELRHSQEECIALSTALTAARASLSQQTEVSQSQSAEAQSTLREREGMIEQVNAQLLLSTERLNQAQMGLEERDAQMAVMRGQLEERESMLTARSEELEQKTTELAATAAMLTEIRSRHAEAERALEDQLAGATLGELGEYLQRLHATYREEKAAAVALQKQHDDDVLEEELNTASMRVQFEREEFKAELDKKDEEVLIARQREDAARIEVISAREQSEREIAEAHLAIQEFERQTAEAQEETKQSQAKAEQIQRENGISHQRLAAQLEQAQESSRNARDELELAMAQCTSKELLVQHANSTIQQQQGLIEQLQASLARKNNVTEMSVNTTPSLGAIMRNKSMMDSEVQVSLSPAIRKSMSNRSTPVVQRLSFKPTTPAEAVEDNISELRDQQDAIDPRKYRKSTRLSYSGYNRNDDSFALTPDQAEEMTKDLVRMEEKGEGEWDRINRERLEREALLVMPNAAQKAQLHTALQEATRASPRTPLVEIDIDPDNFGPLIVPVNKPRMSLAVPMMSHRKSLGMVEPVAASSTLTVPGVSKSPRMSFAPQSRSGFYGTQKDIDADGDPEFAVPSPRQAKSPEQEIEEDEEEKENVVPPSGKLVSPVAMSAASVVATHLSPNVAPAASSPKFDDRELQFVINSRFSETGPELLCKFAGFHDESEMTWEKLQDVQAQNPDAVREYSTRNCGLCRHNEAPQLLVPDHMMINPEVADYLNSVEANTFFPRQFGHKGHQFFVHRSCAALGNPPMVDDKKNTASWTLKGVAARVKEVADISCNTCNETGAWYTCNDCKKDFHPCCAYSTLCSKTHEAHKHDGDSVLKKTAKKGNLFARMGSSIKKAFTPAKEKHAAALPQRTPSRVNALLSNGSSIDALIATSKTPAKTPSRYGLLSSSQITSPGSVAAGVRTSVTGGALAASSGALGMNNGASVFSSAAIQAASQSMQTPARTTRSISNATPSTLSKRDSVAVTAEKAEQYLTKINGVDAAAARTSRALGGRSLSRKAQLEEDEEEEGEYTREFSFSHSQRHANTIANSSNLVLSLHELEGSSAAAPAAPATKQPLAAAPLAKPGSWLASEYLKNPERNYSYGDSTSASASVNASKGTDWQKKFQFGKK